MTIQKRNKRRRRVNPAPPQEEKYVPLPPLDKMVRNYPRICPRCQVQGYSSRCGCGGLTIINKGGQYG